MRHLVRAVLFGSLFVLAGTAGAQSREQCTRTAGDAPLAPDYQLAVKQVIAIPMVGNWVERLPAGVSLALGAPVDAQEFSAGRCYWRVSLYESYPDRARLWNAFLVSTASPEILIQDTEGRYVPIAKPGR